MYNVIYEQTVQVLGRDNVLRNSNIINIIYRVTALIGYCSARYINDFLTYWNYLPMAALRYSGVLITFLSSLVIYAASLSVVTLYGRLHLFFLHIQSMKRMHLLWSTQRFPIFMLLNLHIYRWDVPFCDTQDVATKEFLEH